jgi:NitT/TauT family transport system permease protein
MALADELTEAVSHAPRAAVKWRQQAARIVALLAPPLIFCLIVAVGWQIMARAVASPLVPDVAAIGLELRRIVLSGAAAVEIGVTLERIVGGFLLAFAIALVVGLVSARSRIAQRFFEPALLLGLTVPGLVWALLCVIWFGVGLLTSVSAIALGTAPALTLSVMHGVKAIDDQLIEMAHVFRFSRWARLRYLWLPAILPFLMSGARMGFSLAWKVIVLVEIFGLSNGVGYQLNAEFSAQNVAGVLAWTIAFGIVMAVIEYGLLQTLERRLTRWRRGSRV